MKLTSLAVLILLMICVATTITVASEADKTNVQLSNNKEKCTEYLLGKEKNAGAGAVAVEVPRRSKVVMLKAPGVLDQPDTEYRLEEDIVADGTAFIVTAHRVTLNLNGHTITYNQKVPGSGVLLSEWWLDDVSIVNGCIRQGSANDGGDQRGKGCNPIKTLHCKNIEIAGITAIYRGPDITGFYIDGCRNAHLHHNTIKDEGSHVTNRHQGLDAIKMIGTDAELHHNLVRRCRHRGFMIGNSVEVHNNEIHIDSHATNSCGVMCYRNKEFYIHHNKIFGKGEHPIGVACIAGSSNGKIHSNYIEVQTTRLGSEYGSTGSACIRMTWGTDNVETYDNTFIVHAQKDYAPGFDSWGRAVWVGLPEPHQTAVFHNNVIIANNKNGKAKAAAIAVVCKNKSPKLIFKNNKVVSNWGNVLLSDNYGHSDGYPQFIGNMFEKEGNFESYHTIRCGYWTNPSNAIFTDNLFEEGASLDDVAFDGSGKREILVKNYLEMSVKEETGNPVPQAQVVISDLSGMTVFDGETDSKGMVTTDLTWYIHKPQGKDIRTPHSFMVTKKGFAPKTGEVAAVQNITMKVVMARVPR